MSKSNVDVVTSCMALCLYLFSSTLLLLLLPASEEEEGICYDSYTGLWNIYTYMCVCVCVRETGKDAE